MSETMSEPIDFIDLTVESAEKYLNRNRNRNSNAENIPNNSARTKPRKRSTTKQQQQQPTQFSDSIVEILDESTHEDAKSAEVVDIDNSARNDGTCCINDSSAGKLLVLTCPICYEELSSKLEPMSTHCGHIFCSRCLEQILRKVRKCPTCQRPIKHRACTRLYF